MEELKRKYRGAAPKLERSCGRAVGELWRNGRGMTDDTLRRCRGRYAEVMWRIRCSVKDLQRSCRDVGKL